MRVMNLRDGTQKMSKSGESDMERINMTDDADAIAKKFKKARTDPAPLPENVEGLADRPEAKNLVNIYAGLSGMTAEAVIIFFARLKGVPAGEARKRARAYLERFGLGDAAKKKIKELSKGMAQKVQIISAIIHEPEFIILDEPFSGLDPVNQALLEQMIREQAEAGRTVLFSTHVMEHAERLCNRIILMARGEKVFDGTVDEALAQVPRQVFLAAPPGEPMRETLSQFGELAEESRSDDGTDIHWRLTLKPGTDAQAVLRACVDASLKLTHFEPRRPHLHDAFVALVGEEGARELEASAEDV